MKFFKSLATTLAVGAMSSASLFAFECTGNSECIFQVNNDTPQACIEAIELITGPLQGTGPVQIAIVDYKSLAGTCFTLSTGKEGVNLITQTETAGGYSFVYTSDFVQAQVPGYSGTFYSQNELRLESVSLYPNPLGENGGQIAYQVTGDVRLTNGTDELTVFEGSSVIVETKKPVIVCDLTSNKCFISIDGNDYDINPQIKIESESPVRVTDDGVNIGRVLAKELIDELGLEMILDFGRPADESYFKLTQVDPDRQFPAKVNGYFAVEINYEDETYRTEQILEVEAQSLVEEWPPAPGTVEYTIVEPVRFESESGREIIVHEGIISN